MEDLGVLTEGVVDIQIPMEVEAGAIIILMVVEAEITPDIRIPSKLYIIMNSKQLKVVNTVHASNFA